MVYTIRHAAAVDGQLFIMITTPVLFVIISQKMNSGMDKEGERGRDKREIRKLIISALVKISAARHTMAQGKSENRSQKENSSIYTGIYL